MPPEVGSEVATSAAQMIGDDAVGAASLGHIGRRPQRIDDDEAREAIADVRDIAAGLHTFKENR